MQNQWRKHIRRNLLLALGTGGLVFGSNCGTEIQVISAGLNAAAATLDRSQQDDDISFGDWLADEFKDL